eukprot:TRINITY_DN54307_c0_g1_i1.p1 TRINITY_DN54307_c0_g1~~TRINITY_DN54307_c0_g1_i1.p1  ORF type:complete len:533 (-),score=120.65 TRINITY_DN54307_c0_g1_i1:272-1870(-)
MVQYSEDPEGRSLSVYKDGTRVQKFPDGTVIKLSPGGAKIQKNPNGTKIELSPDGSTKQTAPNGVTVQTFGDGSQLQRSPFTGIEYHIFPDGTMTQINPDGSKLEHALDGSVYFSPAASSEKFLLGVSPGAPAADAATVFQSSMLDAHNRYRADHSAPALEWDHGLAEDAQKQADECEANSMMVHGNNSDQGQNIFMSKPPSSGEAVTAAWYCEIKDYDFDTHQSTGGMTAHFSQVVWCGTRKIGAARSASGQFVVANYSPAGNWEGQEPGNVFRQGAQQGDGQRLAGEQKPADEMDEVVVELEEVLRVHNEAGELEHEVVATSDAEAAATSAQESAWIHREAAEEERVEAAAREAREAKAVAMEDAAVRKAEAVARQRSEAAEAAARVAARVAKKAEAAGAARATARQQAASCLAADTASRKEAARKDTETAAIKEAETAARKEAEVAAREKRVAQAAAARAASKAEKQKAGAAERECASQGSASKSPARPTSFMAMKRHLIKAGVDSQRVDQCLGKYELVRLASEHNVSI